MTPEYTHTHAGSPIYDWWLGGKDNFAADRELGQKIVNLVPMTPASARANRAFLHRAAGFVAAQGLPTVAP